MSERCQVVYRIHDWPYAKRCEADTTGTVWFIGEELKACDAHRAEFEEK